jgi:hypothetical protein
MGKRVLLLYGSKQIIHSSTSVATAAAFFDTDAILLTVEIFFPVASIFFKLFGWSVRVILERAAERYFNFLQNFSN